MGNVPTAGTSTASVPAPASATSADDDTDEDFVPHAVDLTFIDAIQERRKIIRPGFFCTACDDAVINAFNDLPDAMFFEETNPVPVFDRTKFFADTHSYDIYNGYMDDFERVKGGSVTSIAHAPCEPFDSEAHSLRIASSNRRFGEYAGKTQAEILAMWDLGSRAGTALHKGLEYFVNYPRLVDMPADARDVPIFCTEEFGYILNYVEDCVVGKYDVFRTEMRLCDSAAPNSREGTAMAKKIAGGKFHANDPLMQLQLPPTKAAGSADFFLHRRGAPDHHITIGDLKRSKAIRATSFDGKYCKWPFEQFQDCNQTQYFIQLNIYKWLMENNTDRHVDRMFLLVCHPNNGNYVEIEVPDMQPQVQRLMIQRLHKLRKEYYLSDSAEDVRYRAELDHFFATVPQDPTNMMAAAAATAKRACTDADTDEESALKRSRT